MEDIPDIVQLVDNDNDDEEPPLLHEDSFEEGDHIFIATIPCKVEFVCATSNILQQLALAFHKNAQSKSFHESIPAHFYKFEDLFVKSSFDHLPD
jgi:hypothetical protein